MANVSAALLCSLYLTMGSLGDIPKDVNEPQFDADPGYSRRVRDSRSNNAIADALARMVGERGHRENNQLNPAYAYELVLEVRKHEGVPENLTEEKLLSIWADVYELYDIEYK